MAATLDVTQWPSPSAVDQFRDASLYEFPSGGEWRDTSNRPRSTPGITDLNADSYSRIMTVGGVVVKLASFWGNEEYEKYVVRETVDNDAIRGNEDLERFLNFDLLADAYPAFRTSITQVGKHKLHWLLIHRLQFDRLRRIAAIATAVPEARFVFLSKRRFLVSRSIRPALIQKRVQGILFWDMIDHDAMSTVGGYHRSFVRDEYRSFLPDIASQLRPFTHRKVADHVCWDITNFIYSPQSGRLYYVEMKPSNIFGRWRNARNLRYVKRDFLGEFT